MNTTVRGIPFLRLSVLASASLLINGYHLGADDAAIYVPGIKRAFDPELYGFGSQFFMTHAHLSLFSPLIGGTARMLRLPVDAAILACHWVGLVLLLFGAWQLVCLCFESSAARWGGVALLAGTLSVPVAGTALSIADPYVTSRTLSTPFTLLCISAFLSHRWRATLVWLVATVLIHPQMGAYSAAFLVALSLARKLNREAALQMPLAALGLPLLFDFHPSQGAAREALYSRTFFFLYNWTWYEWLGVVAPLALAGWASRLPLRSTTSEFRLVVRTLVPFGLSFTLVGVLLSSSAHLENLARLQPMRAFHIVYVVFFALLGGVLGEYALKGYAWRWVVLFAPLACGMWFLDRDTYESSPHFEWPGMAQSNPWLSAFYWIRANTPKDAVFALGPEYMKSRYEDAHGFRAIAERSLLADNVKDSGVVSIFPELASEWKAQSSAQAGWECFSREQFDGLARRYPVTWVVVRRSSSQGLICPYTNAELAVCRIAPVSTVVKPKVIPMSVNPATSSPPLAAAIKENGFGND